MSAINGDKSRFHRQRKQKIARRIRNRELLSQAANQPKPAINPSRAKPGSVTA